MKIETQGGFLITQIKQLSGRIFEKLLTDAGIDEFNGAQGRILYTLWQTDNIPISGLAKKTGLANSTLTSMLERMENAGLIKRMPDPKDKRRTCVSLTENARKLNNEYNKVSNKMNKIYYAGFSDEEIIVFENTLRRVLNNLTMKESTHMKKSIEALNYFCPQSLFAYGTNKENGTANFGLFSWLSGYFDTEMGIMACLSGDKITKDRIHATKIFSANLVTEELLPFADYIGHTEGYNESKMNIPVEIERGQVLDVPILTKSPWIFELEVNRTIEMDGGDIFFCKIKNVLVDEVLCDETLSLEQRMNTIKPVHSVRQTYFNWNGTFAGDWKTPMKQLQNPNKGEV